jgi:rod shape-determining protein MreC
MKNDYHLFRRTTPQWLRFLITSAVAVALMLIDGQNERLSFVRTAAATLTSPLKNRAMEAANWLGDAFNHSFQLQTLALENQKLKAEHAEQAAKLSALTLVQNEHLDLQKQLALKATGYASSQAAQVLYQVVDPYARKLVLDKGSDNGVLPGQPVITADGLLGQITSVTPSSSELTLILDTKINVPVSILRPDAPVDDNKVRLFLSGKKEEGLLEAHFFNTEIPLAIGDIFVTSGLDGLYPAGIHVGKVTKIDAADANGASTVTIIPTARGMTARHVLILATTNRIDGLQRNQAQSAAISENTEFNTLGARTRDQVITDKEKK